MVVTKREQMKMVGGSEEMRRQAMLVRRRTNVGRPVSPLLVSKLISPAETGAVAAAVRVYKLFVEAISGRAAEVIRPKKRHVSPSVDCKTSLRVEACSCSSRRRRKKSDLW